MQSYIVKWKFHCVEKQVAAYQKFVEYADAGYPEDKFDGFEIKFRYHAPGDGTGVIVCKADGADAIFKHFAPWRAQFGMELDITPAMSCAQVVESHRQLFNESS